MRLTDLMPRWIHPTVFIFLCPHCQGILLSCTTAKMSNKDQRELFERVLGPDFREMVIQCVPECGWTADSADFATMTVSPSLDASKSGHWHGTIEQGAIKP